MEPSQQTIAALLARLDMPPEHTLTRLVGGANNRVYRLECGRETMLLKEYFRHADDPRDRLHAEFAFCMFARDASVPHPPRPLACDAANGLALYEFIAGRPVQATDIGQDLVAAAADFFLRLNRNRNLPAARALPLAAEACFSVAEHLACVERRVGRLERLDDATPTGREAKQLVCGQLLPAWNRVRESVPAQSAGMNLPLDEPVSPADRCISPSDFGFHNAILAPGGLTRFVDFEYAGWDDPAKMVCDFFCQAALPVPRSFLEPFTRTALSCLAETSSHLRRIFMLLPVYQVKWCCIMLNEFLPEGDRRRAFSAPPASEQDSQARRLVQLNKARQALKQL